MRKMQHGVALIALCLGTLLAACRDPAAPPIVITCNGLGLTPAEYAIHTEGGALVLPNRYTEPRRLADTVGVAIYPGRNGDCVTVRDSLEHRGYDFP